MSEGTLFQIITDRVCVYIVCVCVQDYELAEMELHLFI